MLDQKLHFPKSFNLWKLLNLPGPLFRSWPTKSPGFLFQQLLLQHS
uniref:Uncharacterized protein n=1 Tax=Rhizophora mucronata TaxID=61149 RepID=A0A2P2N345_RHIMU